MGLLICFDLEGPLSPQDNAYEVMSLACGGDKIFEVLSFYDDMLTLEGRAGYEPGDTLALIVPFLLLHGITVDDIRRVSDRAKIVGGARELVSLLKEDGYDVHIISTSYEQHAHNVGRRIGVEKENIACTKLNLSELKGKLKKSDFSSIKQVEEDIKSFSLPDDQSKIFKCLDEFFFEDLKSSLDVFSEVRVVGGERKVEEMLKIADKDKVSLDEIIVVGDSITDYKMLGRVKEEGGIAVVFNGNEYAVPYANIGLATIDIRFLQILKGLDTDSAIDLAGGWERDRSIFARDPGSIPGATEDLRKLCNGISDDYFPYFHSMKDADDAKIKDVVNIHKRFRKAVRGEAAKLG
ncbi:MAG: hypothetical protein SVM80_04535 [Halobacteriota archaeon]|nr:hypothetical protein [Halobacteriota archaeon]